MFSTVWLLPENMFIQSAHVLVQVLDQALLAIIDLWN